MDALFCCPCIYYYNKAFFLVHTFIPMNRLWLRCRGPYVRFDVSLIRSYLSILVILASSSRLLFLDEFAPILKSVDCIWRSGIWICHKGFVSQYRACVLYRSRSDALTSYYYTYKRKCFGKFWLILS